MFEPGEYELELEQLLEWCCHFLQGLPGMAFTFQVEISSFLHSVHICSSGPGAGTLKVKC